MADWPDLADLKLQLGVTSAVKDDLLTQALAAAVSMVKIDCLGGRAIEDGEDITTPSDQQAHAALLLAVMTVKAPDAPYGVATVFDTGGLYVARQHPTYQLLLKGQRTSFGVA
jgi:hypothetical protein